jgi:multicomponent Na+:H+ antiporter subunit D
MPHSLDSVHGLLLWLSVPTMVLGVLGALSKNTVRSILSFHIVSQIGYMLLALGLFSPAAAAACLLFALHQVLAKGSLFLIGGTAQALNGSDRLDRMGNLWKHAPWLGGLFLAQALSLAGLPPFSGFWGKALIVLEAFKAGHPWLGAVALGVGLLTLLSMLKIFMAAFWHHDEAVPVRHERASWRKMQALCAVIVALSLWMGLGAGGFLSLTQRAADELFDGKAYRAAVLEVPGLKGAEALAAEEAPKP